MHESFFTEIRHDIIIGFPSFLGYVTYPFKNVLKNVLVVHDLPVKDYVKKIPLSLAKTIFSQTDFFKARAKRGPSFFQCSIG